MQRRRRSEPMDVKYWSAAGLMLTGWCNAACASCYLHCSPEIDETMSAEFALRIWRELTDASPHGCRVHLSGGEPFGRWDLLLEVCSRAREEGLGGPEKIETNAFWATDADEARRRVKTLDKLGMGKLVISADPYHQQFVPIERPRLAARTAEEVLGSGRVQVRWRDWLAEGFDTDKLPERHRQEVFANWAANGRDRFNGRSAFALASSQQLKEPEQFVDLNCKEVLLRSKHVHVTADGGVIPGTCAGIVLGHAEKESIGSIWRRVNADYGDRPIVGRLVAGGPLALVSEARRMGFKPAAGYASRCHLCRQVRQFLYDSGGAERELSPAWVYES